MSYFICSQIKHFKKSDSLLRFMQKGARTCTLEWHDEGSGNVSWFPVLSAPDVFP